MTPSPDSWEEQRAAHDPRPTQQAWLEHAEQHGLPPARLDLMARLSALGADDELLKKLEEHRVRSEQLQQELAAAQELVRQRERELTELHASQQRQMEEQANAVSRTAASAQQAAAQQAQEAAAQRAEEAAAAHAEELLQHASSYAANGVPDEVDWMLLVPTGE